MDRGIDTASSSVFFSPDNAGQIVDCLVDSSRYADRYTAFPELQKQLGKKRWINVGGPQRVSLHENLGGCSRRDDAVARGQHINAVGEGSNQVEVVRGHDDRHPLPVVPVQER